ncbi:uncharacterized protein LOC26526140 [Drosophila erecta]|uniref:uncharacterized protein LOC26526140 n=1 Tax=Drosophila erecta TaxID=7220 RepID=UPI000F04FBF4|nr:uncharacterized protein LOC26526140 [Drosophila erecta]
MCQCSPNCCSVFYPLWCIILGALGVVGGIILACLHSYEKNRGVAITCKLLIIVTSLTYIIAGILMMLGAKRDKEVLFKVGKCLSYIYPISSALALYPIIVHIVAMTYLCTYQKNRWG